MKRWTLKTKKGRIDKFVEKEKNGKRYIQCHTGEIMLYTCFSRLLKMARECHVKITVTDIDV